MSSTRVEGSAADRGLPAELLAKLTAYRRRVRRIKFLEVAFLAAFALVISYLLVFGFDRLTETPAFLRPLALFAALAVAAVAIPWAWKRWGWGTRRLEALARIIARRDAALGDRLLGTVELSRDAEERRRSPRLVEAAIAQANEEVRHRDLNDVLPTCRHRAWAKAFALPALLVAALAIVFPNASMNAAARWALPFAHTPRYTFARVMALPATIIVPRAEDATLVVSLTPASRWNPEHAIAYVDGRSIVANRNGDRYRFTLPPLSTRARLQVSVADARLATDVVPLPRPELESIFADVSLPPYLEIPKARSKDARGGSIAVVLGSRVAIRATATRELRAAIVDGAPATTDGARFTSAPISIDGDKQQRIGWEDVHGLAGSTEFVLAVNSRPDEAPDLAVHGLKRETVLLDSETLTFEVQAHDDFGVRQVGLSWKGIADPVDNPDPSDGERIIADGHPDQMELNAHAAFAPKHLGIHPQALRLRAFVRDALPGRKPVYSKEYDVFVLTPEQHMIWLTGELDKWLRRAVEVRDRELELYQKNRSFRALSARELDSPGLRRKLESQAAAERANGKRLEHVTEAGKQLVAEAARNPEFNVRTMNDWAEMVKTLQDIASNRMPSVADLLARASTAKKGSSATSDEKSDGAASKKNGNSGSTPQTAGTTHAGGAPKPEEPGAEDLAKKPNEKPPAPPSIVDRESSLAAPKKNEPALDNLAKKSSSSAPRLTLPTTTVPGTTPPDQGAASCPAGNAVEKAVGEQKELLAEFDKVAGKINEILRDLEGSTFVKRLKAASRMETRVARLLDEHVQASFGKDDAGLPAAVKTNLDTNASVERRVSKRMSDLQSDLQAYAERTGHNNARHVMKEMQKSQPSSDLLQVARSVDDNFAGESIARAQFWADTFDGWADLLVGPG